MLLTLARKILLWENFTASLCGVLNEEVLFRLLDLSGIAWLLSRVWHTASSEPTNSALRAANVITAILLGLGHFPAARAITGSSTPLLINRTLVLNTPIVLIFGWLFSRFASEAAIIANFIADVVCHVGATRLLRANDQFGTASWLPPAPRGPYLDLVIGDKQMSR